VCGPKGTHWEIGRYINSVVLDSKRAEYGKQIVATLSQQLSWSHFIELFVTNSGRITQANSATISSRNK
jgi:hypothetical protein